jgi:hypothetical protein
MLTATVSRNGTSGHLAASSLPQVESPRRLSCAPRSYASSVTRRKNTVRAKSTAPFARANSAYGSAWTDFTTAPIAEKPATCLLPQITVPAETQTISMQFDADTRLAAAAGGVARYFADAAGLDNGVVSELQSTTIAICKQELQQLKEPTHKVEVTLTRSPDRIEVVVRHPGVGVSGDLEKNTGTLPGVDSVQHEIQSHAAITRLTKYVGESASGK